MHSLIIRVRVMFMGVNHGGRGDTSPRICTGERQWCSSPEFSTYNVVNKTVCRLFTKVWSSHLEWLPKYQYPQKPLGRWGFTLDATGGACSALPYSLAGVSPKTPPLLALQASRFRPEVRPFGPRPGVPQILNQIYTTGYVAIATQPVHRLQIRP